jgi:hypothetical protein
MPSDAPGSLGGNASAPTKCSDQRSPGAIGSTAQEDPQERGTRRQACAAVVAAHAGNTYRLLTDLVALLEASVAYVDRLTIEAHPARPLSDDEWSVVAAGITAMALDEHVGEAGTTRTDWIEDVLLRADVPSRGRTVSRPSRSPRHSIRR